MRGPECAIALALWLWLRKPRDLRALEVATVVAWALVSAVTSYGLSLVPPDKLPFQDGELLRLDARRLLARVAPLAGDDGGRFPVTVAALATLRVLGDNAVFMAAMTVFGFAYLALIAAAVARDA